MARLPQVNFLYLLFFSKLLIGQGIIDSKINEINPPTFEFDRDVRLYEEISSMKNSELYDSVEIAYDSKDSVLISGKNSFYRKDYELFSTGSDNKSKVTAIAKYLSAYDIEKWFNPTLEGYFKNFGKPSKKIYDERIILNSRPYNFSNGFAWDLNYKGTFVKVYVGYINQKYITRNKKGKIKKVKNYKYGIEYTLPIKSSSETPENQKHLNDLVKMGRGFFKSYKNDFSLKSKLSEKYNSEWAEGDEASNEIQSIVMFNQSDIDSPNEYLGSFVVTASLMYDIFLQNTNENITFSSLPQGTIAVANGMGDDCNVDLFIDINQWNNSSYLERIHIIFHELGHDYFNLKHSDGIRLMATNKFNIDNPEVLGDMIQEMFSYVARNLAESDYNCK